MGYLGNPIVQGNFSQIDDISGSFNGSTTQFTIQVGNTTQIIGSLINCLYTLMVCIKCLAQRLLQGHLVAQ